MIIRFVIRNLKKHPFLNLIKVLGLALALTGIVFISLFLKNELSYDSYHQNSERIYRFTITTPESFGNGHFARFYNAQQIPQLADYFSDIDEFVRLAPVRGGVVLHDEKYYDVNEAFECDSTFFSVFDAPLLIGNSKTVLEAPASMVVSETFAKKVFGSENPVGQVISIPPGQFYADKTDYTIKGVMKDFPQNSHFHPDFIATLAQGEMQGWAFSYFLLAPNADPQNITSRYVEFIAANSNMTADQVKTQAHLQNITDIHLHSDKLREIEPNGNMTNIYVLAIAALILLLISMSNYAGLNLGMAGFSTKFMTMNQILGASKHAGLLYFIAESLFIVTASILLFVLFSIPVHSLIQSHFRVDLLSENLLPVILIVILFSLLGILSGLQPVLKQNFDRLFSSLRNSKPLFSKSVSVNKGIIVFQYTFAIALIVAVLIISRQTNFAMKSSMGGQEDNIVCFESVHASVQQKFDVFKAELLKYNSIESVSAMMEPPGGEANDMFAFDLEGYEQEENSMEKLGVFPCDYSFASLFDLTFLSGTNFSADNADAEGSGEYIINEAAMHQLGYADPDLIVGKEFQLISPVPAITIPKGKITGVVKDFHLSSIKKKVRPLVFFKRENLWLLNFVVSYKPGMKEEAVRDMQTVWTKLFPAYPFNYEYVGTMYKAVYKTEILQARLLSVFTLLSIFICSMGLLGLSLLISQQRTKEIGIRKVNGANVLEILGMLNRDFVKWIVLAFVIATPAAWYAMNKWLENFAYKTNLSWWIFALAGLLALGIALLTVSFQSWRAATRNPVESLRYE
ncbi:ABC transporter permease [Maribellus sediminis]|uniref:ABC transporter permease n=1 Tax=Maribellus sediminis TaxID=2696285 RepID=UPI0014306CA3|nr:ABC transporter permease [Maribellus sediminis]